jgi:hypothetical protein
VTKRPPEPEVLKAWRKRVQEPQPKICWTCAKYSLDGICRIYEAEPPADFAEQPGACSQHEDDIPF